MEKQIPVTAAGAGPRIPTPTRSAARQVLLHDHLDGGLRPETVVELAAAVGYEGLPTTDAKGSASGSAGPPTPARWSATWRPSRTPAP